jgi:4-nitrophenyl phosphatase
MGQVVVGGEGRGNVVCDLDGVVYLDLEEVPGAGAALRELERQGQRILFVTNNSSSSPATVAGRIAEITHYPAVASQVLTSGLAVARMLAADRPRCLVVGGEGIELALDGEGIPLTENWRQAEAVVVGLDRRLTYERLRDATLALRAGARFLATNVDPTFPTPIGQWPGAGSIVAALQAATDRVPEIAGKPYQPMRELVSSRLGPGPVWVVGDRPSTDLAMAHAEGWQAVLVLSGVATGPLEAGNEYPPDLVVESLADLPGVLATVTKSAGPAGDATGGAGGERG